MLRVILAATIELYELFDYTGSRDQLRIWTRTLHNSRAGNLTGFSEAAFAFMWLSTGPSALQFPLWKQRFRSADWIRADANGFPVGLRGGASSERLAKGGS
jgi:hypothetical protein